MTARPRRRRYIPHVARKLISAWSRYRSISITVLLLQDARRVSFRNAPHAGGRKHLLVARMFAPFGHDAISRPPHTLYAWPVIAAAASLASRTAIGTHSSGSSRRPIGVRRVSSSS